MSNPNHIDRYEDVQPTIIEAKQIDVSTNTGATQRPPSIIIVNHPTTEIDDELKMTIYSRARIVKWLAIIDMVFLTANLVLSIVNGNLLWIFFILFPLCFLGYNGAKKYKREQLTGYVGYLGIMTFYYLIMSFYYNNFWWLLIFFIEVYILYYTSKLYNLMRLSPDSVIESLQSGWDPHDFVYYYY